MRYFRFIGGCLMAVRTVLAFGISLSNAQDAGSRPEGLIGYTELRKLADRGGYRRVVEFLDVPDFHGGSSDVPMWTVDGQSVFYTALVDRRVSCFA